MPPRLTPLAGRRLAALAVGVALLYGAFEYGRSVSGYSALSAFMQRQVLVSRIAALDAEKDQLRRRMAAGAVARRVDAEAQSESQAMIGELEAELSRQQQELEFYRGLVAEKFGAGAVKVQELAVRPAGEGRYTILVTLVYAAARNSAASGSLTLTVTGTRGGALARLGLAEIAANGSERVAFNLKYFTTVEIPVSLPEGFTPAAIELEFRSNRSGPEPVKQSFPWSGVLAGEADSALTGGAAGE